VRREAERRGVRQIGFLPALAGSRGEPQILRRELQAFLREAGQLLLEIGVVKSVPTSIRRSTPPTSSNLTPLKPVTPGARIALGVAFFVLFFAAWRRRPSAAWCRPPSSPTRRRCCAKAGTCSPRLRAGYRHHDLARLRRLCHCRRDRRAPRDGDGRYKPIEAFFEPFISFSRYLPASAFIPLLILWAGTGEAQKLLVIFVGSFFQIVLMVRW